MQTKTIFSITPTALLYPGLTLQGPHCFKSFITFFSLLFTNNSLHCDASPIGVSFACLLLQKRMIIIRFMGRSRLQTYTDDKEMTLLPRDCKKWWKTLCNENLEWNVMTKTDKKMTRRWGMRGTWKVIDKDLIIIKRDQQRRIRRKMESLRDENVSSWHDSRKIITGKGEGTTNADDGSLVISLKQRFQHFFCLTGHPCRLRRRDRLHSRMCFKQKREFGKHADDFHHCLSCVELQERMTDIMMMTTIIGQNRGMILQSHCQAVQSSRQ